MNKQELIAKIGPIYQRCSTWPEETVAGINALVELRNVAHDIFEEAPDLLRAALALVEGQGWQLIETAPEAEWVLIWVPSCGIRRNIKTTHPSTGAVWWDNQREVSNPTHWQREPLPPVGASGGASATRAPE